MKGREVAFWVFENKSNPNKFIKVYLSKDGHYSWSQYIYSWNSVMCDCVCNYTGGRMGKEKRSRVRFDTMKEVLTDDYHSFYYTVDMLYIFLKWNNRKENPPKIHNLFNELSMKEN